MDPVQITPQARQDITKLEQGVDRAQVALDALRESNLSSEQVQQLEPLLKTVSPTEGAASATTSEAVAELKLVDGHQAVVGKIDEELAEILSRCRFVPRVGTRRFGERFAVELWSRSHRRDLTGNLHLRIVPLVPLASTDEAFLRLAMDAHHEMSRHANPGIAAFARKGLERLTGERLPAGALEHRRIMLWQGDTSYEATTNKDGEAYFPGVELDKECSLSMDPVKASNVLTDG